MAHFYLACDQALFSFRLVNPFLRKAKLLASDPVRVSKSDAKIRLDRRLIVIKSCYIGALKLLTSALTVDGQD